MTRYLSGLFCVRKLKTVSSKKSKKREQNPCKPLLNLILYTGAVNTVTLAMIQEVATRSVALPRKDVLVFLRS